MRSWRLSRVKSRHCTRKIITSIFPMKLATEFVEQTGGWITGMVLSNLPGMARVSGVDTFAYLGHQVLDQQPEPCA